MAAGDMSLGPLQRGLNKSDHCMVTVRQDKKSSHCKEVAISGGSTVHFKFRKNVRLSCFKPKLFLPLKLLDCWRMVPRKLNLMARGKYTGIKKRDLLCCCYEFTLVKTLKTLHKSLVTSWLEQGCKNIHKSSRSGI